MVRTHSEIHKFIQALQEVKGLFSNYEAQLSTVARKDVVLKLLLLRDTIGRLYTDGHISQTQLAGILSCDDEIRTLAPHIVAQLGAGTFHDWRNSLNQPTEWWWHLEDEGHKDWRMALAIAGVSSLIGLCWSINMMTQVNYVRDSLLTAVNALYTALNMLLVGTTLNETGRKILMSAVKSNTPRVALAVCALATTLAVSGLFLPALILQRVHAQSIHLVSEGQIKQAIDLEERALTVTRGNQEIFLDLGTNYCNQESASAADLAQAEEYLNTALFLGKANAQPTLERQTLISLSNVYIRKGQLERAQEVLENLLKKQEMEAIVSTPQLHYLFQRNFAQIYWGLARRLQKVNSHLQTRPHGPTAGVLRQRYLNAAKDQSQKAILVAGEMARDGRRTIKSRAHCILASVHQAQGQRDLADQQWGACGSLDLGGNQRELVDKIWEEEAAKRANWHDTE